MNFMSFDCVFVIIALFTLMMVDFQMNLFHVRLYLCM